MARKPSGRGGWRPNAGRRKGRNSVAHETRAAVSKWEPQHVTLRLARGVERLRRGDLVKTIWDAIEASQRASFRLVHFCVEDDHFHSLIEATDSKARTRGVQGLMVRFARRLNKQLHRTGPLFDERYHARSLSSPIEVRNALRYVLNNARHHALQRGQLLDPQWIDPYSSAYWFDGWRDEIIIDADWKRQLLTMAPPTRAAKTWLLSEGWRVHGPLAFDEIPGPKT